MRISLVIIYAILLTVLVFSSTVMLWHIATVSARQHEAAVSAARYHERQMIELCILYRKWATWAKKQKPPVDTVFSMDWECRYRIAP